MILFCGRPKYTEKDVHLMYIICHEVFFNDAMKPLKVLRHFKSKHFKLEIKPCEYFKPQKQELGLETKAFNCLVALPNKLQPDGC